MSVGCDDYQHIAPLFSGEQDAKNMFKALGAGDKYGYSRADSKLLLTPTFSELSASIVELYDASPTDLTFYFAGHSQSSDGRLFLKLKDTRDTALPVTSQSFGQLVDTFCLIPSLQRLNVILDSCNSGGIGTDLANILSDGVRDGSRNVSISILSAAASGLSALATRSGGHLTQEILKGLRGDSIVQKWSPFLELSQIAEAVKQSRKVASQHPSYWGMNIRGPNPLAGNPRYDPALGAIALPESYFGTDVRLGEDQQRSIRRFLSETLDKGYDPQTLRPVQSAVSTLSVNQQVAVFLGLSETVRSTEQPMLGPPRDKILLIQALLPLCSDPSARQILNYHIRTLASDTYASLSEIAQALNENPLELLRGSATLSHLYSLPIALSQLLGWIGFCLLYLNEDPTKINTLRKITETIIEHYGNNFVCIEDKQAPGLIYFYFGARKHDWNDESESIISLYYSDLISSGARIAKNELNGKDKLDYLLKRENPLTNLNPLIQSPSELAAIILLCGSLSAMDDHWDPLLYLIDHTNINFFLHRDFRQFADERIEHGKNVTLRLGEHFWSLLELRQVLQTFIDEWTGGDEEMSPALDAISIILGDRINYSSLFRNILDGLVSVKVPYKVIHIYEADGRKGKLLYSKGETTNRIE